jgi:hypothetical protein
MMSAEQLDWYKRMTPRERTRLMRELMDLGWAVLRRQGSDRALRSVTAIARLHRASNQALLEGLDHRASAVG